MLSLTVRSGFREVRHAEKVTLSRKEHMVDSENEAQARIVYAHLDSGTRSEPPSLVCVTVATEPSGSLSATVTVAVFDVRHCHHRIVTVPFGSSMM